MSLFGSLAREFKGADGLTWGEISTLWAGLFGTYQSRSGVAVGWKRALHVSTFLACTRRIAEAVSTVPPKVYKKPRGEKREEAFDHPLYDLLDSEPNEWQDPLQFKETLAVHCAVTNNAYAFKNVVRGKLVELIPIVPTHVQPKWTSDRTPYYVVTAPDGSQENLTSDEILHIRSLSWVGLCGLDAAAAGASWARAGHRADPCDAACPRCAAERHHLGRQEPRREGTRPARRLGQEALQRPR